MDTDVITWPDFARGLHSSLEGVEIFGFTLRPVAILTKEVFEDGKEVPIEIRRIKTTTDSDIERVEEVSLRIYGREDPYATVDIAEAIVALMVGYDVTTPEKPGEWEEFYFDYVEHREGPTHIQYPDSTSFPVDIVLSAGARPTS